MLTKLTAYRTVKNSIIFPRRRRATDFFYIFIYLFFSLYRTGIYESARGPSVKTAINYGNQIKFHTSCTVRVIYERTNSFVRTQHGVVQYLPNGVRILWPTNYYVQDGQVTSKRVSSSTIRILKVLRYKILDTPYPFHPSDALEFILIFLNKYQNIYIYICIWRVYYIKKNLLDGTDTA